MKMIFTIFDGNKVMEKIYKSNIELFGKLLIVLLIVISMLRLFGWL